MESQVKNEGKLLFKKVKNLIKIIHFYQKCCFLITLNLN